MSSLHTRSVRICTERLPADDERSETEVKVAENVKENCLCNGNEQKFNLTSEIVWKLTALVFSPEITLGL